VVAGVLVGLLPLVARPVWAADVVAADSVSLVSDPGVRLVAPADGRLRGDHLAATVTGVAWATRVGFGASARQAASGQQLLVVFGLQGAHLGQTDDRAGKTIPPVTGTVIVDGQRSVLPAPDTDDGSSPVYYLASVPSAATVVDIELAAAGLAQGFSLIAGSRVGPQPTVLYRDRVTWQPTDQVNAEMDVATPDPADKLPGATLPIRVHGVYLAWFGPDSPANVPASTDRAWLVVDATSQDDSQIGGGLHYLHYLSGLTAAQVTLSLPDGQTVVSQLLNPGTAETGVGVFDGIYDFSVPADLTAATLTVAPGPLQATVAYSGSSPVTVVAHGQASFPISFPAVYQPPPPVAFARPGTRRTAAPSPASGSGGGGLNPAIPIGAVVAVLLAVAAVAVARRRRHNALPASAVHVVGATAMTLPAIRPDEPIPNRTPPFPSPSEAGPRPTKEPAAVVPNGGAPMPVPLLPQPASPPVLTPIPTGPTAPPEGMLYFEVLGPYRITGWPADQPQSVPVIDLATYLALHPERAYTAEELRDPLSIGKPRALEADTIRTYANTLRRTVGPDRLPDAGRRGYTLTAADTDWRRFLELSAATGVKLADEARSLAEALAVVRGLPFTELPPKGFGWVATELLISKAEVAVIAAAARLAELALAAGDWPLAAWAAERGVFVSPTAQELNASALRAAAESRQPDRLAQAWRDITRRHSAADEAVPGELTQLHEALRRSL
jgi:hypothetical protein